MKICTNCLVEKPLSEFGIARKTKDGKTQRCIECRRLYQKENKIQINARQRERRQKLKDQINAYKREALKKTDPRKLLWKAAQIRAKRKKIPFEITIQDIIIPDKCPLLGLNFERGSKGNYPKSYSLDRIDNSKGYLKDNIMVITAKANTMKSNASIQELLIFSKNILKLYDKDDIVRPSEKSEELEDKELLG